MDITSDSALGRRSFLKTAGGVALLANLPGVLQSLSAQEAPKTVTIAFVGCAHIHTPGFIKLLMKERKDVKVKYVWDHNAARAENRASEVEAKVVSDLNQIWSDREVTAVVICSETNRHLELIRAAAAAGKHIFAEKPLGITASESFQMAELITQAKVLFTTGYFMRTSPQHLFLKQQIEQGAFGKITRVRGSNCHAGSLKGWFDDKPDKPWENWRWMADPKISGVGAFGDLGTHMLDILMWLCGDIEAVSSDIRVVNGRYGACDETGEALLSFRSGIIGTLAAGWVDIADPVTLQISGTEASAVIVKGELFYNCPKLRGANGKLPWTELPARPVLPMHQFINAVAGQAGMPLVPVREAAARVAVMEAAYQASKTGTRVKVS